MTSKSKPSTYSYERLRRAKGLQTARPSNDVEAPTIPPDPRLPGVTDWLKSRKGAS